MNRFTLAASVALMSLVPALGFADGFGMANLTGPTLTWPTAPAPATQSCFAPDQITPILCPLEH